MANKFDIHKWLGAQRQNILLWAALTTCFGSALYFTCASEPKTWLIIVSAIVGFICAIIFRKKSLLLLCAMFVFGFGYAGIYSHMKSTPMLAHNTHGIEISGKVLDITHINNKSRISLDSDSFGRIRVSTSTNDNIMIGDFISGDGGLFKPKPADIPNGFDFARHAYFSGITASGYINNLKVTHTAQSAASNVHSFIKSHANSFLTDTLVLGDKNALSRDAREIWATNGMAHIWSISGYHISLIAGWLFIIFYFIFRLCPPIVRHVPARIPALICTWFCLGGYVLLSGCAVATLRAFIMATLVMLAFIIGRTALSLRTIGIAMFALVLFNPYFVMQAGFQLSFAAIFGLVWLWQDTQIKMPQNKILKYLYAAFLTAFVAGIFTAPFVAAHFGSLPIYGILGNLVFLPVFSFILMPLVMIGTITSIFGLGTPLAFAHRIYDMIFDWARYIASLPAANITIPNLSNLCLILIIIGLACLIFLRNVNSFKSVLARHLNIVFCGLFVCCGLLIFICTPRPVFYISNDHKLIGAVIDGELKFNKTRDSGNFFAFDTWKKLNGEKTGTENKKLTKESGVYIITNPKWKLAYIQTFIPLSKNFSSLCESDDITYIASFLGLNSEKCDNKIIRGGAIIYPSGYIKYIPANRLWHNPQK